jgi:predicted nucleotidyltransferase
MNLFARYDRVLAALLEAARSHYGKRLVSFAVYGSVGRGTQREDSDIDLLIVAEPLPDGRMKRVAEFLPVEAAVQPLIANLGWREGEPLISPVFKTPEEIERGSPLLLDLVEDARILHDAGGFLAARLDRLRQRMKELGSVRVVRANARHWVLKPDLKPGEVFEL